MATLIQGQVKREKKIKEFQMKANILDELLEFIEEKYLGHIMKLTEKEPNIPLSKAQKLIR